MCVVVMMFDDELSEVVADLNIRMEIGMNCFGNYCSVFFVNFFHLLKKVAANSFFFVIHEKNVCFNAFVLTCKRLMNIWFLCSSYFMINIYKFSLVFRE